MNKEKITIRKAEEKDFPFILRVNEENVEVLSPMDEEKLRFFVEHAAMVNVAEVDGETAGFLIVMREGNKEYESENYKWFSANFPTFLYIDRVVIDEPFRGIGIGKAFYEDTYELGRREGVPVVTAEVDTVPYNGPSLLFHEQMGFKEVGEQLIRGNTIKVSLQAKTL